MARRLYLLFLVSSLAVLSTSVASDAASRCPRILHDVLGSPACRGHRRLLVSAARTTIDATGNAGDGCVDSLRVLLTTAAASMPCTTSLDLAPAAHARQLETGNSTSTVSDGYNCTVTVLTNGSALSEKSFVVDCEPVKPNLLWLWICLGVFGGLYALWCLVFFGNWFYAASLKPCLTRYSEHRRERAGAKAKAKARAKAQAKFKTMLDGHPYRLA